MLAARRAGRDRGGAASGGRRGRPAPAVEGKRRHASRGKGLCAPGGLAFGGPQDVRRRLALGPRGSHPRPAVGAHARALLAVRSAIPPVPLPGPRPLSPLAASPFLPPFPHPLGHLLVPLGARNVEGAIPGSPGSRLRPPESSKRLGSGDCGLDRAMPRRVASWDRLDEPAAPPSFAQAAGQGEGLKYLCPVRWRVGSPPRASDACAGLG